MKYPEDIGQNFPPEWRHLIQQSEDSQCYIDFYRTIYVPSRFTMEDIEQTVQQCRDVIIKWGKTTQIHFEDGKSAPLQNHC